MGKAQTAGYGQPGSFKLLTIKPKTGKYDVETLYLRCKMKMKSRIYVQNKVYIKVSSKGIMLIQKYTFFFDEDIIAHACKAQRVHKFLYLLSPCTEIYIVYISCSSCPSCKSSYTAWPRRHSRSIGRRGLWGIC